MTRKNIPKQKKSVAPPPPPPPTAEKRVKTVAEIIDEKMAAMAADPNAVAVYFTERGYDAQSWELANPEYKILEAAFKGGYGWWDLTEGRGRHLLPKPKPYKIVNISTADLKALRAREAAATEAKKAYEAELEAIATERQAAQAKAERELFISVAVEIMLDEIRAMPAEQQTIARLVDYVVERIDQCPQDLQESIMCGICAAVEREHLIFYTPVCSPELPAVLPHTEDMPALDLGPPLPPQLACPPENIYEFVKQPPFVMYDTLYSPIALLNGVRMYVQTAVLEELMQYILSGRNPAPAPKPIATQPSPELLKTLKITKFRMPRTNRIQQILRDIAK